MIAFGPVPSRRLGRSLGINNIPPKICTYSCACCQLGRTIKMQVERRTFYEPEQVLLPHWIEHNAEHAGAFRDWAERAGPARDGLLAAAQLVEDANARLQEALMELGGPSAHHHHHD